MIKILKADFFVEMLAFVRRKGQVTANSRERADAQEFCLRKEALRASWALKNRLQCPLFI